MEGFSLFMALVDAVPVLCFGASMIFIAARFGSPLFIVGAFLSTAAGACKVAWKLILATSGKNVHWLNRIFLPVQITGFMMILVSFLLNLHSIRLSAVLEAVTQFPNAVFYVLWVAGMAGMMWYRKNRFDNSAKANWTAQTINCIAQTALLLGLML